LSQTPPLSILTADIEKEFTVELNSLSKSFNMAGWRVGMLMASRSVVDAVLQVKSNVDSGMFLPVQAGATEALKSDGAWHVERNEIYLKRRELVWKIFDRLGFKYSREQVGLFVWAKAPDAVKDVAKFVDDLLDKAHVFLTPGFIFGSNGDRYARASLCADVQVLEEALRRVEALS
jgi:aspartate/methionine/tyrosine aminotransferase